MTHFFLLEIIIEFRVFCVVAGPECAGGAGATGRGPARTGSVGAVSRVRARHAEKSPRAT